MDEKTVDPSDLVLQETSPPSNLPEAFQTASSTPQWLYPPPGTQEQQHFTNASSAGLELSHMQNQGHPVFPVSMWSPGNDYSIPFASEGDTPTEREAQPRPRLPVYSPSEPPAQQIAGHFNRPLNAIAESASAQAMNQLAAANKRQRTSKRSCTTSSTSTLNRQLVHKANRLPNGRSLPEPGRRHVKPRQYKNAEVREDRDLVGDSHLAPTGKFTGYFSSKSDADKKRLRIAEFYQKPAEACSTPETDNTFPQSDEDYKAYVKQIFDAIFDWSDILEWLQVSEPAVRERVALAVKNKSIKGNQAKDMRPRPEDLAAMPPMLKEQRRKILGRDLNDQIVELLSWDLLSLLHAGNGWVLRVANNPFHELRGKKNNQGVNLIKNHILKEATKNGKKARGDNNSLNDTAKESPRDAGKSSNESNEPSAEALDPTDFVYLSE
ncbi:hypothetical protein S40288_09486 [Stachybotrys chartarum IBT 40288]|nr:hypothetical protein S40288_09486 [Stachybotrys chartarum IBT 40288]